MNAFMEEVGYDLALRERHQPVETTAEGIPFDFFVYAIPPVSPWQWIEDIIERNARDKTANGGNEQMVDYRDKTTGGGNETLTDVNWYFPRNDQFRR